MNSSHFASRTLRCALLIAASSLGLPALAASPRDQARATITIVEPVNVDELLGSPANVGDVLAALHESGSGAVLKKVAQAKGAQSLGVLQGPLAASVSMTPNASAQSQAPVLITVAFN